MDRSIQKNKNSKLLKVLNLQIRNTNKIITNDQSKKEYGRQIQTACKYSLINIIKKKYKNDYVQVSL